MDKFARSTWNTANPVLKREIPSSHATRSKVVHWSSLPGRASGIETNIGRVVTLLVSSYTLLSALDVIGYRGYRETWDNESVPVPEAQNLGISHKRRLTGFK